MRRPLTTGTQTTGTLGSGARPGESLSKHTTLEVGGEAAHFAEPATEAEAIDALSWARAQGLSVWVLGGGSNVVVADRGLDGLVLRPALAELTIQQEGHAVELEVGAGYPWDALVARTVELGLAGLECLSGIPGRAGAAPIQNIGAYGQEVGEVLTHVVALDRATGERVVLRASELALGYRTSALKTSLRDALVVVRVGLRLALGGAPTVRYAELERSLDRDAPGWRTLPAREALGVVRERVLALRRGKSMVLDAHDENRRSVGSFFTNPVVSLPVAHAARARLEARGSLAPTESMPTFAAPAAHGAEQVKLSAGWLIERSGFERGFGEGAVGLSTRHALAVVNRGGATASEVVAFAARVRAGVREASGVTLHPEAVLVGFSPVEQAALED